MKPEARIKANIRAWLNAKGAYTFSPVQTGMGMDTLDILVCLNGRFIGIEAKVPGKTPTARQDVRLEQIRAAGGTAFWCDSLEMCKEELAKAGWVL